MLHLALKILFAVQLDAQVLGVIVDTVAYRNSDKGLQPLRGTRPLLPARRSNLDAERAALLDVDVDASNAAESETGTSTVAAGVYPVRYLISAKCRMDFVCQLSS